MGQQKISPEAAKIRATIASFERDGKDTRQLRVDLRDAMLVQHAKEQRRQIVDLAPPLSEATKRELTAIYAELSNLVGAV